MSELLHLMHQEGLYFLTESDVRKIMKRTNMHYGKDSDDNTITFEEFLALTTSMKSTTTGDVARHVRAIATAIPHRHSTHPFHTAIPHLRSTSPSHTSISHWHSGRRTAHSSPSIGPRCEPTRSILGMQSRFAPRVPTPCVRVCLLSWGANS